MGILKFLFWAILGLFGIKKKGTADATVNYADYRTEEQDRAVYYFSDKNRKGCLKTLKGCFAKKAEVKVKKKGCFPKKMGFVSDQDYDALVASIVKRLDLKNKGLLKVGLDESQVEKIINFGSYVWDWDNYWRYGEDGRYRSSKYQVTYLFFTRNQIVAYQITLSSDWEKLEENTFEYHYKDITAVKTVTEQTDDFTIKNEEAVLEKVVKKNEFVVQVSGDSFSVSLGNKPTQEEENTIQAMKAMIREKKA